MGLATAPQGWVRTDLATGETKARWIGTRHFTEEVVVVPKGEGDQRGGGEHPSSECWVLGMVYDARAKRSGLCVLDGETMEVAATLWMKHVSPHGLHGSWRPAAAAAA